MIGALVMLAVLADAGDLEPEVPEYSLEQAVELALERNLDLAEALSDIRIAEAEQRKAEGGRLPTFTYLQFFGLVPEARGDAVFSPDPVNQVFDDLGPFTQLTLLVVQPLYTFGRLEAARKAATLGVETTRAAREQKKAEVAFSVCELYHNVILNQSLARELKEVEDNLAQALEKARERLEAAEEGVTQVDVLRLELGVTALTRDLVNIRKGERLSRAALARAMGLPIEAEFKLKNPGNDDSGLEPLSHYAEKALLSRPELRRLSVALAAQNHLIDSTKAAMLPTVFLMGLVRFAIAPNRTDQLNPFVRDEFNYIDPGVILGLTWHFDWVQLAELKKQKAVRDKLRAASEVADRGIALDVKAALEGARAARESLAVARKRRKTARNLTAIAAANFELGVGDAKTVLEALESHAETTSELYLAIRDHNTALVRLQQAAGFLPQ